MNKTDTPAKLLLFISLLQGLLLLLLHQAIELRHWPHGSPQWLFSFYSMALVGPTMLLLGLKAGQLMATLKWVMPFTLVCGLLGFYIGYQATPIAEVRYSSLLSGFVATMAIASFKALMYAQQFASGERFSYSHLFRWSWRNFLTLGLALLFAASFYGVLMLWAGLFKAININFFFTLFTERWFFYPALALANGFGVIIFRNLSQVIDTITRLQQALMKFLLVLLVLVSILFLSVLPVTGLAPLWATGGSTLILWMQAIMLFFINAVYQDDPDSRPYHLWLHRFIYCGIALLPIYSAISFYGLSLRIDQHGWSIARCWGMLIWSLLALFSLGYLWGILKQRDAWLQQLSKVNVVMGLVLLAAMLLINSPLLDFRKIVVHSQIQRLQSNHIGVDKFDVGYFKQQLARPGYLALEELKTTYAKSNPELVLRIKSGYRSYGRGEDKTASVTKEDFLASIRISSGEIPAELGKSLYEKTSMSGWSFEHIKHSYLMPVDLDNDGQLEYLFIKAFEQSEDISLYFWQEDKWRSAEVKNLKNNHTLREAFYQAAAAGEFSIVKPKWQNLQIGGYQLQVQ